MAVMAFMAIIAFIAVMAVGSCGGIMVAASVFAAVFLPCH